MTETNHCVDFRSSKVDVLVTGSLHLVGGVLSVLDPDLSFLETEKQIG